MKRSLLFAILGVIVIIMVVGIFAVNLKKPTVSAAPAPVQTSAVATGAPTIEPTISATEESADDEEIDLSNYKPHKLPADTDKWTDEEWEWWSQAAASFLVDYDEVFEDHFGSPPTPDVENIAQNFAEEVCSMFDDGATVDDIAEAVVDSGGSKQSQMALAMVVHPGVANFCPWNDKKLN